MRLSSLKISDVTLPDQDLKGASALKYPRKLQMEILHQEPQESAFVPLSEHQSQTPQSFYSGPPILYHLSKGARFVITAEDAERIPAISKLTEAAKEQWRADFVEDDQGGLMVEVVDIWVTSE